MGLRQGEYIDKYPDLFTLDRVYEQDFEEYANVELTLIVNETNENAINYLLMENQVIEYEHFTRDNYHFYRFFYSIKRGFTNNNKERRYDWFGALGPDSNDNSINISRYNYIIGSTQVGKIFGDSNYLLKDNFYKLDNACYLSLNNGREIYSLKEFRRNDSGASPKYYEDLQGIFCSKWEDSKHEF
ncbi:hypothetical protein [Virgibacillus salinus]|uniref:Uncharacterized protein n=1 Tax=Virgibacillus salinus TaxID=553311 RepID=A0A1H1GDU0_9BACI|nr:hypothetical protein [Virgibacillus salinus]SDR11058.1 hypothetical protein SAMN05216231_3649 [Virgibacillus salinus]